MPGQADYKHSWNRRLYHLMGSQGWTMTELAEHLGFTKCTAVSRVLKGGRPAVKFLIELNKLEKAYAEDIKEFIRQYCPYKYNRKQRKLKLAALAAINRPANKAPVVVLGTLGSNRRPRPPVSRKRARQLDTRNATKRRNLKEDKEAKARQSYVEWKRSRAIAREIKRRAEQ